MEDSVALVAIVGMLAGFGLPLTLVAIVLYYKHRKVQMNHETITRLVEKGQAFLASFPNSQYEKEAVTAVLLSQSKVGPDEKTVSSVSTSAVHRLITSPSGTRSK